MVYYYYKLFANEDKVNEIKCECKEGKRGCVSCKKELAETIIEYLKPFREKRAYYDEHPEEIDKIVKEGTERARIVARETMKKVKKAMKLDYFE